MTTPTQPSPKHRLLAVPGLLLGSALTIGMLASISCNAEEDCIPGYPGCSCFRNVCLEGLECLSNFCVDPNWVPPEPGGGQPATSDDGNNSPNNVAACNDMLDELSCGSFDLGSVIDCGIYADLTCDISDYFDCIRDVVTCTDDVVDASGIVECAELAACQ